MADINTFIQTVKLPVMPEAAHALIRTLNDEDADVVTVRDIIAKDPALTTTLLRMANSALFGLSRTVTTLDSAVTVPMFHVKVGEATVVGAGTALTKLRPLGSVSVIVMFGSGMLPLLAKTSW